MMILHSQIDRKQGMKHNKQCLEKKVSCSDVSPTKQMCFCTNEKLMSIMLC